MASLSATAHADASKGTILLTGFEPFQNQAQNPSWEAIKELDHTVIDGYDVVALKLPVEWGPVPRKIEAAVKALHPVALISFGEGVPGEFHLEEVAHDRVDPNLADAKARQFKAKKIRDDGPDTFASTLPLDAIQASFEAQGLSVARSQDPGSYVCEYTFYLDRYTMTKYGLGDAPVGFVHVPYVGAPDPDETDHPAPDFAPMKLAAKLALARTAEALDATAAAKAEAGPGMSRGFVNVLGD